MRSRASLTLLGICLLAARLVAQVSGVVNGSVLDQGHKPVVGAAVHIARMGPFYGSRIVMFYQTDQNGKFVIHNVPWGSYAVLAGKESAGYPDTRAAFYSNGKVPIVVLAPEFPSETVTVTLGPKAGAVDVISVIDAITGADLKAKATITLWRSDKPNFSIATSTTTASPILIPSGVYVVAEISAEGYNPWPSARSKGSARFKVKPAQIIRLAVRLMPQKATN